MKRLASAVLMGIMFFVATSAHAFEVKVPVRSTARANIAVDENGTPLFSAANPAQVEVTNFPPPSTSSGTAVFTVYGSADCPSGATLLYSGSIYVFLAATVSPNPASPSGASVSSQC